MFLGIFKYNNSIYLSEKLLLFALETNPPPVSRIPAMSIRAIENCQSPLPTDALEPLTPGRCHRLAAALAGLAPQWSVELHYDEQAKAAIVIMPDDLDDASFPTLLVRTDASAFHLEELCGNAYRKLGEYRAWADVLRAVQIRLAWAAPLQTMLH
jgi:hypothetical protein